MTTNQQFSRISVLPGSLVNQIAAGEVIERPSSVVKELIENAIDSNANRIEIDIQGGGTDKIIIRDNGNGIHPDDMRLAIKRHSTSKLHSQQDLETINSLGFRGEALSTIASVSDFCLTSRISSEDYGRMLIYDPYTSTSDISPAPHQTGTTVEVNKLFSPVPVRRKFLRSNKTEFLHIQEIVKRFVMSQFNVEFIFYHNGKLIFNCPAVVSDYRTRLSSVMGRVFYTNAWRIDNQVETMSLWGWLGSSKTARSQSDRQYLFLNNRIIKDKHLSHAIRKVMNEIIPDSRYPSYALNLSMEPSLVDVNVHPAKQEVRFKNPRNVHDFVYAALNDAVTHEQVEVPGIEKISNQTTAVYPGVIQEKSVHHLTELNAFYKISDADEDEELNHPLGRPFAVIYQTYVLAKYHNDFRIINYGNLKRRYIYTSLKNDYVNSQITQRPLLVPVTLSFEKAELTEIISYQKILNRMGVEIEQSGPLSISVRTIPAIVPEIDIQKLLTDFIKSVRNNKSGQEWAKEFLLKQLSELGGYSLNNELSIKDIEKEFNLLVNFDLPFSEKKYPGYWNTLSINEIKKILSE